MWKRKAMKASSDAGLNILGLGGFPSAQAIGIGRQLMDELKNLPKRHYAFYPFKFCLHRKEAHVFYERIDMWEIKHKSIF